MGRTAQPPPLAIVSSPVRSPHIKLSFIWQGLSEKIGREGVQEGSALEVWPGYYYWQQVQWHGSCKWSICPPVHAAVDCLTVPGPGILVETLGQPWLAFWRRRPAVVVLAERIPLRAQKLLLKVEEPGAASRVGGAIWRVGGAPVPRPLLQAPVTESATGSQLHLRVSSPRCDATWTWQCSQQSDAH